MPMVHALDDLMDEWTPEEFVFYRDVAVKISAGGWFDPVLIDLLSQGHRSRRDRFATAWLVAHVQYLLDSGGATLAAYSVGCGPNADLERGENQAALSSLAEWDVWVDPQGHHGADGVLTCKVDHSIAILKTDRTTGKHERIGSHKFSVGHTVPLEIGYIPPATAWHYLGFDRQLARWAYGHDHVWVLVLLDEDYWSMKLSLI